MEIFEIILGIALVSICIISTKTDLQEGKIHNRTLKNFIIFAILLNVLYYAFFAKTYALIYVVNVLALAGLSLLLFYTHSFAGGDCKLAIVLALLYPGRYYLSYGGMNVTLFVAIGFALLWGYLYLLFTSMIALIKKNSKWTSDYVKVCLIGFIKSFVLSIIYICAINLVFCLLKLIGLNINIWIIRIICMTMAWFVGRKKIFRNKHMVCVVLIIDIVLSLYLKIIPLSIHKENFFLVIILLICQMTIKASLYEVIPLESLQSGMILSVGSSILMQGSRVRGLPNISTEDLESRLTKEEVESIKRWGAGKEIMEITIIKKIPFAIFLGLGFLTYFSIGRAV